MVYYRKYRPQTIAELDSSKVRDVLTAVLSSKDVPHAFLFTGPKGLGKTSTARIIAKMVNCQNKAKGSIEPCNTCDSCISITNGSNIDVLEIDGASNRGIDEMRDLRDKVKLAPSSAKKKVYIIDEVHMLTTEAFNALLKTIEEPPSHVMFVFATTEPQKVPATILSRCFHVAFPKATDEDIVHSLKRIVKGEGLHVDDDALLAIAKLADGGFRDGAKLLEEVVLLAAGEKITQNFIQEKLQSSSAQLYVSSFLTSLQKKQPKESLEIIKNIFEQGIDMKYFLSQVLNGLHELLLVKNNVLGATNYQLSSDLFKLYEIEFLVNLFAKAYQDTKYAVVSQLPLELAVIDWCQQNEKLQMQSATGEDTELEVENVVATPTTIGVIKKSGPTLDETRKKEQTLKVRSIIDGPIKQDKKKIVAGVTQNPIRSDTDPKAQLMENIIYKVKPHNHSLAGILRGCDIALFEEDKILLETAYKFHKERLDDIKSKELLGRILKELTGKEMQIMIELKSS